MVLVSFECNKCYIDTNNNKVDYTHVYQDNYF